MFIVKKQEKNNHLLLFTADIHKLSVQRIYIKQKYSARKNVFFIIFCDLKGTVTTAAKTKTNTISFFPVTSVSSFLSVQSIATLSKI